MRHRQLRAKIQSSDKKRDGWSNLDGFGARMADSQLESCRCLLGLCDRSPLERRRVLYYFGSESERALLQWPLHYGADSTR